MLHRHSALAWPDSLIIIFSGPCALTKFRLYVYKRRGTNTRFRIPRLTEGRMFQGKLHDEEDDELPRSEEEGGAKHPHEVTIKIEEVVIEEDDEAPDTAPTPAPRKLAPAAKAKPRKKAAPKKKAKAKSKRKSKPKKAAKKRSSKRKKR